MLQKRWRAHVRADEAVKKQLDARLRRLRRRAVETAAEIVMVERLLADIENRSTTPNMKLRKNGLQSCRFRAA